MANLVLRLLDDEIEELMGTVGRAESAVNSWRQVGFCAQVAC
jgi:hypothetical protein